MSRRTLGVSPINAASKHDAYLPQSWITSSPWAAAGITRSAAEHDVTMEKQVQLHFPLSRIAEPIVTRLVTDYDLEPNLLRADVDAASGGWMVVGLSGPDDRVAAALDWLRGQGLVVSDVGPS